MGARYAVSLLLNAHVPFVRELNSDPDDMSVAGKEGWFFDVLSETCLPLLEAFGRLEADSIPFRLSLALSPSLCHMLGDELLLKKYLSYTDRQIEFGRRELERTAAQPELHALAQFYFNRVVERRVAFSERYEGNLLKAFDHYQRKGKLEIVAAPATNVFLPFFCPYPEAIQAQMETALFCYRRSLGLHPQGFWLPELGWSPEIDLYLKQYNFSYTLVDTHGFVFGRPSPSRGCFYPVKTPAGLFVLARDFYAIKDLQRIAGEGPWRDNNRDSGYELPVDAVAPCVNSDGGRCRTGFKYWKTSGAGRRDELYNPAAAQAEAGQQAKLFIESMMSRLSHAADHMKEIPLSLCAVDADSFGRLWYEGPYFIETMFRLATNYPALQFTTPSEYIYHQHINSFEISVPAFSSSGPSGYAEAWLHASSDWMYRHLFRAVERMVELTERFPDDSGIKERALNQAVRELLLAQCSDWPKQLYKQESAAYARNQIEEALRNFTTIYEALGSNYISAEWLTNLERRRNIFPALNYRVFKKKKK